MRLISKFGLKYGNLGSDKGSRSPETKQVNLAYSASGKCLL